MSKPKSYTIKVSFDNDAKLVAQANEAHTYPTTLLQEFINNTIATNGKLVLVKLNSTMSDAAARSQLQEQFVDKSAHRMLSQSLEICKADLQAATAALAQAEADVQTHKQAIETIIKNAQVQFPISRKQLLKNVAI